MHNVNNQLTTRSSRRNMMMTPGQSNDELDEENVQRVRVREQCAEWRCTTTRCTNEPQGNIHIAAAFDQARLKPVDLENPYDLRSADRVTWAEMSTVKPLYEQETEARESITKAPIRFSCLYCNSTFKKMKNCKEHVVCKSRENGTSNAPCDGCARNHICP
uniref:Uncharacterized protein n=1 Tax=Tetranychus urticae TaxID=32264 RepID=T1KM18_TETUR